MILLNATLREANSLETLLTVGNKQQMTSNVPLGQELKSVRGKKEKRYLYNRDFYLLWASYTVRRSPDKYLEMIMIHSWAAILIDSRAWVLPAFINFPNTAGPCNLELCPQLGVSANITIKNIFKINFNPNDLDQITGQYLAQSMVRYPSSRYNGKPNISRNRQDLFLIYLFFSF